MGNGEKQPRKGNVAEKPVLSFHKKQQPGLPVDRISQRSKHAPHPVYVSNSSRWTCFVRGCSLLRSPINMNIPLLCSQVKHRKMLNLTMIPQNRSIIRLK